MLLYGCETWPISGWKTYDNNRDENGAIGDGGSPLEHLRIEEILEEANVEPIAMVMRRRRLEWFGHVKGILKEIKPSEQLLKWRWRGSALDRGRPKLRWKDAVRRSWKPRTSGRNEPLTRNDGKVSARHPLQGFTFARPAGEPTRYPAQWDGGERRERKFTIFGLLWPSIFF